MFYFTAYYGPKTSLLYHFYLAAYKVYLGVHDADVEDELPFNLLQNSWLVRGINDFTAPFVNRVRVEFAGKRLEAGIHSSIKRRYGKRTKLVCSCRISLDANGLTGFSYESDTTKLTARCVR
jgi:hypothetical protein